ncbi:MAG: helix-turn-helix transcriptional regulator [Pseudomonadota bacterium]
MKTLKQYLADGKISQSRAAAELGVSRSHISEVSTGVKLPSIGLAYKIYEYTGGQVDLPSYFGGDND